LSSGVISTFKYLVVTAGIYIISFAVSLYGPVIAKMILTGTSGPNTRFTAAVVICPTAFMILGLLGGRRLFALHSVLIALLGLWYWTIYPANPLMNFMRQIADDLPPGLATIYLLGAVIAIALGLRFRFQQA
jgi:hypothetical protein